MGINARMVVAMMTDAGMGENAIIAGLKALKPVAHFGGAPYFDVIAVSRYIKKHAI